MWPTRLGLNIMSKFEIFKCLYNICWDLLREITVSNSFWREGSITIIVHSWFHSVSLFNCPFVVQLLLIGCSIVTHWLFNCCSLVVQLFFSGSQRCILFPIHTVCGLLWFVHSNNKRLKKN